MLRTVRFSNQPDPNTTVRFKNRTHNWKYSNRVEHKIVVPNILL